MLLDLWGQVSLDVNAFRTESRDRIVWLPATGTYWSPQNIGEVTSRGIETEVRWRLPIVGLEVLANSTWQKAAKTSSDYPGDPTEGALLPYVPEQTATVQVTAHLASVDVSLQNIWTSFRYTNPTNSEFVPAFSVTSATVGAHRTIMGAALSMKLDLLNLFNTRYSSFALYPMPGREVRVTLGVTI
jgi:outer membrane receptor protein involved in Fe transport